MIIKIASRERESTSLAYCDSHSNKSSSDHGSFKFPMVFPNNNMEGEELTRSEYEVLMKGYKDIIDDVTMKKSALQFTMKSCNRNSNHNYNLHQMKDEVGYVSTAMSNNLSDGKFNHLNDMHHDLYSPHERQQHEMALSDFNKLRQLHLYPKVDISNNNVNQISMNNDYAYAASSSSENISKLTTTISDRTSGCFIPKISFYRDEYHHNYHINKLRSHCSSGFIPAASLHRDDSYMKGRKILWNEIHNNNIVNTMNNHHHLCQETWMYAKNTLSPMFEDDIKEHPPEYDTYHIEKIT